MTTATIPLRPFRRQASSEGSGTPPFKKLTARAHYDDGRKHCKRRHPSNWRE